MNKKTNKKINKRKAIGQKKPNSFFTYGEMDSGHGRILILIILIIFFATFMLLDLMQRKPEEAPVIIQKIQKNAALEKDIKEMVQGYPIEKMTPYIIKENPKTAMFLVAIAKKESAWGKRHPVLDGKDCFNYWGFRLKAERMGSGGHTCFDSPQEAVKIVASRIDELVINEKIDNPNKMIVWKCGYACQNRPKDASEKKWIKDVGYYYNELLN